jgi:sulfite reductase (ferredoxin)
MAQDVVNRALSERFENIPPEIQRDLDVFAIELDRFRSGDIAENVFTEFRLRHGVYGQRQEGVQMIRIKIPYGAVTAEQMEELADCAEEFADGISHMTTRQDIQYHYVKIGDTPALMQRLASVGITTAEACGNVVRNVTGCPKAGVCTDQAFDVTPYAKALTYFLLRHPDLQNFGRKFKISFSGCEDEPCGLGVMHDIGAVARTREVDGKVERGFKLFVGGGLGAVPHQAKVLDEFLPVEELLPIAQAMGRVFSEHGERKRRMKARMKFLIAKMGLDEFRRLVYEEREKLDFDPRWTDYLNHLQDTEESPLKPPSALNGDARPDGFNRWYAANVTPQRDTGYSIVQVTLPLGDITADQFRALARVSRKYIKDTVRITVPQNLVLRWVSNGDLVDLYSDLVELELGSPGAEGLSDVLACPGTDSCKLGIASSRGLAAQLRTNLEGEEFDDVRHLSIKISGCPNSCGQHHIADIGFFGSARRQGGHVAPHFQLVLGGEQAANARSYGLAIGKVPSKKAPELVERLLDVYRAQAEEKESFAVFVRRLGKERIKEILTEFDVLPEFDDDASFYADWLQTREFSLQSGVGECAGELVDLVEFMLTDADRFLYEAALRFEKEQYPETADLTTKAMVRATEALLTTRGLRPGATEESVSSFKELFVETGQFWNPFAEFLDRWLAEELSGVDEEGAHFAIEEATLFVEQAQTVYGRMQVQEEEAKATKPAATAAPAAAVEEIVDSMDLKGVECPYNYVRTKLRLEQMESGQLLEITIDDGEPIRNVPASLGNDGHEIVDTKKIGEQYRLVIRKA